MSKLPKIRVTETAGLRRFLYPLTVKVKLPDEFDYRRLSLYKADGTPVPIQTGGFDISDDDEIYLVGVDFAVSLAPNEAIELEFREGAPEIVPDRLNIKLTDDLYINKQQRIRMEIGRDAMLRSIVYDRVSHLRAPLTITRTNHTMITRPLHYKFPPKLVSTLSGSVGAQCQYEDGIEGRTSTSITACKSWATVSHGVTDLPAGDAVTFTLPFAATGEKLVADFGTGNGTYAHIPAETDKAITWRAEQSEAGWSWQLHVNDRLDYSSTLLPHELAARNWFHVIDAEKSIAVAVLSSLDGLASLETRITGNGDIVTTFICDESERPEREFKICYHFLNALPPIAAATNPHSILEPPVVEVITG